MESEHHFFKGVRTMMVDIVYVFILLIWSIICIAIGIATGLWYCGDKAINEWFERELEE